jgi:uncharacterized LabA/DUF88 family protein
MNMSNLKHNAQRVLVLFDVQNMYYSAKHLFNAKVNFKTILDSAVAGRTFVRAIAYTIRAQIKEEQGFYDALENIGIEVKTKDLQVFYTGDKKGDWDIGIAMDAVRLAPKVDTIVLVSGDGDFKDLITYLKSHGLRVEVIAFGKTASKMIKEEADDFIDLASNPSRFLRKAIARQPVRQRPPQVSAQRPEMQKEIKNETILVPVPEQQKEKDLKASESKKTEPADKQKFTTRLKRLIRRPKNEE